MWSRMRMPRRSYSFCQPLRFSSALGASMKSLTLLRSERSLRRRCAERLPARAAVNKTKENGGAL